MSTVTILTQTPDLSLFPQKYIRNTFIWDPRPGQPFIYLMCDSNYPDPAYMLKFNRETMTMVLQVFETHNEWSSYGEPDIDTQGRIYWSAPGGLTYVFQKLGRFSGDTLTLLDVAFEDDVHIKRASGPFRVDRRSALALWWHREGADLYHGRIDCFSQSTMTKLYTVPKETFGIGTEADQAPARNIRDMDGDASGVLWAIQDWPTNPAGPEYRLFQILPTGAATMVLDLSTVVADLFVTFAAGESNITEALKWIALDNSLVVYVPPFLLKIDCASLTIVKTLQLGERYNGKQSFHHTRDDARPFVWLGMYYLDSTLPVPEGALPYFPEFVEVDLVTLTVTRTERCPEVGVFYPFVSYLGPFTGGSRFAQPSACLYDPIQSCLTTDDGGQVTICHYCFEGEVPVVRRIIPQCPPIGVTLETTHTKSVFFPLRSL